MNSYVKTIESKNPFFEVSAEYKKDQFQERQAEYKLRKEMMLD